MKIAIISDIHGNIYALEALLKVAEKEGVEKLLILGDVVGYYYHPKKIMEVINNWDHLLIRGNHEDILGDIIAGKLKESAVRLKYGSGHCIAIEQLSESELQLLLNAPEKMQVECDGIKILMCHGAPWQTDFYLYPDTDKEILNKCKEFDVDLVFCGHSHYAFIYKSNTNILVNCGSVGQSRSLGGQACWALLNTANGVVQLMSTPYHTQPLIDEVKKNDPELPYLENILSRK